MAQAERPGGGGLPQTHVGIVDPGEDFTREDGIRRDGQRHGCHRVPEIVDTVGNAQRTLDRRDDGRHGREALRRGLQQVRPVAFVAEHDGIDAAGLESFEITCDMVDDGLHAAIGVVERCPRQRQEMGHRDDGFARARTVLQPGHDVPVVAVVSPSARRRWH